MDDSITVTTTNTIEGRRIVAYLGLVVGETILGANMFKDLFAGIRNIVGGRSEAYEKELGNARALALDDLRAAARELGANAVVGIDIDYEVITMGNGNMLMVSISGTAVRAE